MKSQIIKYALTNLWNRRSRSLLTVLSILIGITSIFIFASFGYGLYSYVDEVASEAGVDTFLVQPRSAGAPGLDNTFALTNKDLKAVEKTDGVRIVTGMYMKAVEVRQDKVKKYVYLIGYKDDKEGIALIDSLFNAEVFEGRQLKKGDSGRVVLGYNYMLDDKIFSKGYGIGNKITLNGIDFDILGFYTSVGNPQDDSNIYMLEEDVLEVFGDDTSFGMFMGKVENPEKMQSTIDSIKKELRKTRDVEKGKEDFFVQSYEDTLKMFTSVLNVIIGFIFLIVIISAVVASVNTANTMITSVLERVREIGIMKSIGATNAEIRNIFIFESSMIGGIAGILGVLLGLLLSSIGGAILESLGWSFLAPKYTVSLFVICIALSTLVGMFSGLAPALYASKQKPVDALRYE